MFSDIVYLLLFFVKKMAISIRINCNIDIFLTILILKYKSIQSTKSCEKVGIRENMWWACM